MVDHSLDVGADIHTYCTRCKADRWHVIVAKVGAGASERIKRVQCKTCDSLHNLREEKSDRPHKEPKSRKAQPRTRRSSIQMGGYDGMPKPWQALVNDREVAGEEHQSYSIRKLFEVGNLVEHPKFGLGVVLKLVDNNQKAEVAFKEGIKLLVVGRG
jgi:hypothetical protein